MWRETTFVIASWFALIACPARGQSYIPSLDISQVGPDGYATAYVTGLAPDTCVPQQFVATIEPGRIDIELEFPSLNTGCFLTISPYSFRQPLGPIIAGQTYDLYVQRVYVDANGVIEPQPWGDSELVVENYEANILGDFNGDEAYTVEDINLLSEQIHLQRQEPEFDLNWDGKVDVNDLEFWVVALADTYLGDANLDGLFNSSDLVQIFQAGEYEDGIPANSTWSEGDWNADLDFTSADFVAALQNCGYEGGCCGEWCGPPRAAVPVPTPSSIASVLVGCLTLGMNRAVVGGRRR